jgi:hypothetical protein
LRHGHKNPARLGNKFTHPAAPRSHHGKTAGHCLDGNRWTGIVVFRVKQEVCVAVDRGSFRLSERGQYGNFLLQAPQGIADLGPGTRPSELSRNRQADIMTP